jgi:MOSC domain-containing protein YiiM
MTKLNPDSPLRTLMETFPMEGRLEWIGLRPGRRAPLLSMNHVEVIADHGFTGDHKAQRAAVKRFRIGSLLFEGAGPREPCLNGAGQCS